MVLCGRQGTLVVSEGFVLRHRADDSAPVSLEIPADNRRPNDVLLIQHAWNRLVADFITAIRTGNMAHRAVPSLPTFADGLRSQEMIIGAERAVSNPRWIAVTEV